jgi:hypothetical protein
LAPKLRRRDCASTCGFVVRACSFCCLDRAELLGKLRDVLSRRGPETFDVKAVVFVNNDVALGDDVAPRHVGIASRSSGDSALAASPSTAKL